MRTDETAGATPRVNKTLTQAAAEKAKPKADRYEIPDGLLVGLRLTVQPSGHKSWCVRTRVAGRLVKYTLGPFPAIGLAKARDLARDAILKAKQGTNPIQERRTKQRDTEIAAGNTLRAVAEQYLHREGKHLRSVEDRRQALARLVFPVIGAVPIAEVKRTDIVRLLDRIEDHNGARMADLVLAYIRKIMNWHASRSDDYGSPIVRGMSRHEAKPRDRVLSDDEMRAVWKAAEGAGPFGAFVRFLLLTSARRSEVARMCWDEIEGADWTLPAARNKTGLDLVRPLNTAARDLLASIPRVEGCAYVFSTDGVRPIGGFGKAKAAFDRVCEVRGWVLHDLRRSARSMMSRAGVTADIAEMCLGHKLKGVRGVYDRHEYHAEKKRAFESLAALIDRVVNPFDNVSVMRR